MFAMNGSKPAPAAGGKGRIGLFHAIADAGGPRWRPGYSR